MSPSPATAPSARLHGEDAGVETTTAGLNVTGHGTFAASDSVSAARGRQVDHLRNSDVGTVAGTVHTTLPF